MIYHDEELESEIPRGIFDKNSHGAAFGALMARSEARILRVIVSSILSIDNYVAHIRTIMRPPRVRVIRPDACTNDIIPLCLSRTPNFSALNLSPVNIREGGETHLSSRGNKCALIFTRCSLSRLLLFRLATRIVSLVRINRTENQGFPRESVNLRPSSSSLLNPYSTLRSSFSHILATNVYRTCSFPTHKFSCTFCRLIFYLFFTPTAFFFLYIARENFCTLKI